MSSQEDEFMIAGKMQSGMTHEEEEMITRSLRQASTTKNLVEKLRFLCLSRGTSGILGFGRMFRRMDDDGNKKLSYEEFSKGLKESKFLLTDDEMRGIFNWFDNDKNGSISLNEFLEAIRPPLSPLRLKVIKEAFRKMDKTGDGVITSEDLKTSYRVTYHPKFQSGEETEEEILRKFLANFESENTKDGKVTEEEFINYYSGVSATIDDDMYFDLMMRQTYKF